MPLICVFVYYLTALVPVPVHDVINYFYYFGKSIYLFLIINLREHNFKAAVNMNSVMAMTA